MPSTETTESLPAAEEPTSEAAESPRRKRQSSLPNFDEIVTPHPVVAFLFRRRTLLVLLAIVVMIPFARPRPDWLMAGITLAVLAEMLRIWASGTIHKSEELTTSGPYAFVRHPLYVGSFLHAIAYCLMSGQWGSFLFAMPLFFAVYGAAVTTEEAMLHKLFGEKYEVYARQVPAFIPRPGRHVGGPGRFSWRQVAINKEYVNLIWLVLLSSLFALRIFQRG